MRYNIEMKFFGSSILIFTYLLKFGGSPVDDTAGLLFQYMHDLIADPVHAKLDTTRLDPAFIELGQTLVFFGKCITELNNLAAAMARGDLSAPLPSSENSIAAPMKELHASLKHLTYQTLLVAMGDYQQRVEFMGEFSDAFNSMVHQLSERQKNLENEIELTKQITSALEQSFQLLNSITQTLPQPIIVLERTTKEILFLNGSAQECLAEDAEYVNRLVAAFGDDDVPTGEGMVEDEGRVQELNYKIGEESHFLSTRSYYLEWYNANAVAFVINDISQERNEIQRLETFAYHDALTGLYNRFFGMLTINEWVEHSRAFALVFADLDRLKYINDVYGHNEGDQYIIRASKHLQTISADAIVCRIGGDEFMVLVPGINEEEARAKMAVIYEDLRNDEYVQDKEYEYSVSYGVSAAHEGEDSVVSELLSLADERMYENKRERKMDRRM